ncbi:ABC transporter permease [Paenibacillus hamazuiensis]|uniref:ABC transporter permease n=1 Tax=Paenibacillus hamazuiensis TaxID=2936508 RepID=UPI00200D52FD|nr:ABC transporter permease [Paenibacillus hamazuiensis]
MRRMRNYRLPLALGIVIIVCGLSLAAALVREELDASGPAGWNKIGITVYSPGYSDGQGKITEDDIRELQRRLAPRKVAYSARTLDTLETEKTSTQADVIGVGGQYGEFAALWVTSGSPITEQAVLGRSRIAVISENTAEKLFGSQRIVGKTIRIHGETFTVAGIYRERETLVQKMADNGVPDVYVPATSLLDLDSGAGIGTVEWEAADDAPIRGKTEAGNLLTALDKNKSLFGVTNYAEKRELVGQVPALCLLAAALVSGAASMRLGIRLTGRLVGLLQAVRAGMDWQAELRVRWRKAVRLGTGLAALIALNAAVWRLVGFRPYIPPEWIPEQWIDIGFFAERIEESWYGQTKKIGYAASMNEWRLARIFELVTLCGGAALLLGWPAYRLGRRIRKTAQRIASGSPSGLAAHAAEPSALPDTLYPELHASLLLGYAAAAAAIWACGAVPLFDWREGLALLALLYIDCIQYEWEGKMQDETYWQ